MMNSEALHSQNHKMNTGDSGTYDSRLYGETNFSTLQSCPDHSISTTGLLKSKQVGALQLLTDLLGQSMKLDSLADFKGHLPTIPINDLRGEEASVYSREECILRRSLAALYRLIDVRGWTQSIYNHVSVRAPDNPQHFLINPFGLLYHEIQASNLVKIDVEGNIVQQGSSVLGINKAGWTLHSALHSARPDVDCIVHVHLPDVIAVSCIRAGLLPVSPEANELISMGVCYHVYRGILVDENERASIQEDIGPKAKVLFLRNHGVVVTAANIPEAWYILKRVVAACQTQMRMLQLTGGASILEELKETASHLTNGSAISTSRPFADHYDSDKQPDGEPHILNGKPQSEAGDLHWSSAELEFEAEMRVLDSAGFRTGHIYRQPNLLRRTNATSTWGGDTMGDQMTGVDLLTTDFSATEFSAVDDITAAESAGAQQKAKIVDNVKANRLKSAQRNQWLSDKRDPTAPGLVSRSSPDGLKLASKSATLPANVKKNTIDVHTTNTLQSADGIQLSGDEEKPKSDKKVKKKGSFRIPSFSRKKKH